MGDVCGERTRPCPLLQLPGHPRNQLCFAERGSEQSRVEQSSESQPLTRPRRCAPPRWHWRPPSRCLTRPPLARRTGEPRGQQREGQRHLGCHLDHLDRLGSHLDHRHLERAVVQVLGRLQQACVQLHGDRGCGLQYREGLRGRESGGEVTETSGE